MNSDADIYAGKVLTKVYLKVNQVENVPWNVDQLNHS